MERRPSSNEDDVIERLLSNKDNGNTPCKVTERNDECDTMERQ